MSYDVLADLCDYLSGALGVPCSTAVPTARPAEFVTLERTGGGSIIGRDSPNLAVQCWSSNGETAAYTLALAAREAILSSWEAIGSVCRAEVGSIYRFPDPDSRTDRYQLDASLVTR